MIANRWSCLPASFAYVLSVELAAIIEFVGHDGSEVLWPELAEPMRRRAFHIQEMIDFCWTRGVSVTPIQPQPTIQSSRLGSQPKPVILRRPAETRCCEAFQFDCVLTGETLTGQGHAIAWRDGIVIDPALRIDSLHQFVIETIWVLKSNQGNFSQKILLT